MLSDGLDDAALDALIVRLTAAYEETITGGGVAVVAGEGRRMEYTRANNDALKSELKAALREKQRRDPNYCPGGALAVEF